MKTQRAPLTHALTYDSKTDRWSCKCGYILGTGHAECYALCPLARRNRVMEKAPAKLKGEPRGIAQRRRGSSTEFNITSKTSKKAQQLFDI